MTTGAITGLDHAVVLARDIEAGVAAYRALLGVAPSWRANGEGSKSAFFTLENMSLELLAPDGGGAVQAAVEERGEGLASLCFRVDDVDGMHRKLERRAMRPEPITLGESRDETGGRRQSWRRTRTPADAAHGIRLFFIQRDAPLPRSAAEAGGAAIALDHVVISTPDAERAAALYGARLGLDLALDRTNPAWEQRLMFFRCGGLIIEVSQRLKNGARTGPDSFYGFSWRVDDIEAAGRRLADAGVPVSEARQGRKPGTKVVTVKSGTLGVPTILLGPG